MNWRCRTTLQPLLLVSPVVGLLAYAAVDYWRLRSEWPVRMEVQAEAVSFRLGDDQSNQALRALPTARLSLVGAAGYTFDTTAIAQRATGERTRLSKIVVGDHGTFRVRNVELKGVSFQPKSQVWIYRDGRAADTIHLRSDTPIEGHWAPEIGNIEVECPGCSLEGEAEPIVRPLTGKAADYLELSLSSREPLIHFQTTGPGHLVIQLDQTRNDPRSSPVFTEADFGTLTRLIFLDDSGLESTIESGVIELAEMKLVDKADTRIELHQGDRLMVASKDEVNLIRLALGRNGLEMMLSGRVSSLVVGTIQDASNQLPGYFGLLRGKYGFLLTMLLTAGSVIVGFQAWKGSSGEAAVVAGKHQDRESQSGSLDAASKAGFASNEVPPVHPEAPDSPSERTLAAAADAGQGSGERAKAPQSRSETES